MFVFIGFIMLSIAQAAGVDLGVDDAPVSAGGWQWENTIGAAGGIVAIGTAMVAGFWKWMLLRTRKREDRQAAAETNAAELGRDSFRWMIEEQRQLRKDVDQLQDSNKELRAAYNQALKYTRWLCEYTVRYVNELHVKLNLPLLKSWPPNDEINRSGGSRPRPETPNSTSAK